jgi:DNA-binding Xre family transcriptional regulator
MTYENSHFISKIYLNRCRPVAAHGGEMEMPKKKIDYSNEEKQFLKNLGYKIQFLRKTLNISQSELAEKANMSYTTISHLESTSVYGVSLVGLYRLAKALNVTPDQLLRFE